MGRALAEARWSAVAAAFGVTGDLQAAEDAVQEACAAALDQWADAPPEHPQAWLAATARHKAVDQLRREALRPVKELAAAVQTAQASPTRCGAGPEQPDPNEQLALLFLCCHPAFDPVSRTALTLRAVCGLSAHEIGAVLLLSEPAVAKRLVRARRKIRDSRIRFAVPDAAELAARVDDVLGVLALLYTEGHRASTGPDVLRPALSGQAITVSRLLARLLPEAEVLGLLALLVLTDARAPARTDTDGNVIPLAAQDRSRYDRALIAEGEQLLERALRLGRPGRWQLQAAIAACHTSAPSTEDTDWREVAALYGELLRHDPNLVHEANRAIAVAMAEGPAAGLAVLDAVAHHPQLARWPALHVARADLLRRLGRDDDAHRAYTHALTLDPGPAERRFIHQQLAAHGPSSHDTPDPGCAQRWP